MMSTQGEAVERLARYIMRTKGCRFHANLGDMIDLVRMVMIGLNYKEEKMYRGLCLKNMLRIAGVTLFGLIVGAASVGAVDVLVEPFDDSSQFTISEPAFFSDGSSDYFGLHGSADNWGAGTTPSGVKAYTGFDTATGSILTGMDLDGEGASLPIVVDWTGLNIAGLTGLQFSGDFAEFFDDPGDIDEPDYILVQYQIDGGGYLNLMAFEGADFTSSGIYNGIFRQDTNFDGTGDGLALGNAAQNFAELIVGTGTTLDIRLLVSVDSGDEDFGIDNFLVIDGVPVELQSFSIE